MVGKYILRSVKSFILVAVLFCIVVLIMYYFTEHDANLRPYDLFHWKQVVAFLLAYAVIYPMIGYSKREVAAGSVSGDSNSSLTWGEIASVMRDLNFKPSEQILSGNNTFAEVQTRKFHNNSPIIRFLRLFEDTLTFTFKDGLLSIEGQRKDVVRAVSRIEWYIRKKSEKE